MRTLASFRAPLILSLAVLLCTWPLAAAAVTVAEATAFFKDLDDQLLPGHAKGPDINALYNPGVANPTPAQIATAAAQYRKDLGQSKGAAAASSNVEYYKGHGR